MKQSSVFFLVFFAANLVPAITAAKDTSAALSSIPEVVCEAGVCGSGIQMANWPPNVGRSLDDDSDGWLWLHSNVR